MNNNRGYTYVEALMAAALLAIFIMPVLAGFFNAAASQRFSRDAYEASLYAGNLLTEAGAVGADGLNELLDSPAFERQYKTELYDYCLYVYEYGGGGLTLASSFRTGDEYTASAPPEDSGVLPGLPAPVAVSGGCALDISGGAEISAEGGGYITVVCENSSDIPAALNIYTTEPEKITLDCRSDMAVFISGPPPKERVLLAEVYGKDGQLLHRLAAPVVGP